MARRVAFAYTFDDAAWAGGRNYFASLFRSLQAISQEEIELVFVTGTKTVTSLPREFPFLEVHRTPLLDRMHPLWLARQVGLRFLDTDPLFARYLRRLDVDVLSHSGYLGRQPGLKTLPWLFDFQFLHLPAHWTAPQLRWVERRYRAACQQGDGVIVSSFDARRDLEQFLPDAAVPVHVLQFVSNHASADAFPPASTLCERYALPRKYFHLPNQFWTHKNHGVVIDALAQLKGEGIEAVVACTGNTSDPRTPGHFEALMARAEASGVASGFRVLGLIPYADTQALMAHAQAVINPSRFEGWSTTVEEAKTLHKRLLLSDLPVHREQSPSLGKFFSPDDPHTLARLMRECLETEVAEPCPAEIEASYRRRSDAFAQTYLGIVRSIPS
jgi:glycosyltransferase involved in cell wall biosynthesis